VATIVPAIQIAPTPRPSMVHGAGSVTRARIPWSAVDGTLGPLDPGPSPHDVNRQAGHGKRGDFAPGR